jgi:hypothetical protein
LSEEGSQKMLNKLNSFVDVVSDYLSQRKGLLPIIGIFFIIINLGMQVFDLGWLTSSNLFLHLGIIIAILGIMVAWAL